MDKIVRLIAKDAPIKAVAISATDMVERAREIHDTWPVATAALGRLLMGASMMGNMIKTEDGSVTLRVNGGGPLGTITAVSDHEGNTRGYVYNGAVDVPRKAPQAPPGPTCDAAPAAQDLELPASCPLARA